MKSKAGEVTGTAVCGRRILHPLEAIEAVTWWEALPAGFWKLSKANQEAVLDAADELTKSLVYEEEKHHE